MDSQGPEQREDTFEILRREVRSLRNDFTEAVHNLHNANKALELAKAEAIINGNLGTNDQTRKANLYRATEKQQDYYDTAYLMVRLCWIKYETLKMEINLVSAFSRSSFLLSTNMFDSFMKQELQPQANIESFKPVAEE
jgi:hypothetical protein